VPWGGKDERGPDLIAHDGAGWPGIAAALHESYRRSWPASVWMCGQPVSGCAAVLAAGLPRPTVTVVVVDLIEISAENRDAVLAVRVAPEQERFVGSVRAALRDAAEFPQGNPWYRAVYAGPEPVGFVMISWDVRPEPPHLIGPWFLWKLLIDHRHQGRGYGRDVVGQVADLVRAHGGRELLTSYVPETGGPARFYQRLGFIPTGRPDVNGEVIVKLALT
jgi:GNAT superfamily N-acetyltransferase